MIAFEASGPEIIEGLIDFLVRVHHEQAAHDDRLVDDRAGEDEHARALIGSD
jgi:hypothetical protein